MKANFLVLFLASAFMCANCTKKEEVTSDVLYTKSEDAPDPIIISSTSNTSAAHMDLNKDGFIDFSLIISKIKADGVYYLKDANRVSIRTVEQYLQEKNPFYPLACVDKTLPGISAPLAFSGLAKLFHVNDEMTDDFELRQEYYLYKDDDYDTYKRTGNYYVALKMQKGAESYYGWAQFLVDGQSATVKDYAFCKTPGRKLKIGATN